jgi:hypothetical protein
MVNSVKVNHKTPAEMANMICSSLFFTKDGNSQVSSGGSTDGNGITLGSGKIACRDQGDTESSGSGSNNLQAFKTNPLTIAGKIVYGIIAAVVAFCIIGCGTSPIGSMFVVLIANICSPIIQFIEDKIYIQILKLKGKSYDR